MGIRSIFSSPVTLQTLHRRSHSSMNLVMFLPLKLGAVMLPGMGRVGVLILEEILDSVCSTLPRLALLGALGIRGLVIGRSGVWKGS